MNQSSKLKTRMLNGRELRDRYAELIQLRAQVEAEEKVLKLYEPYRLSQGGEDRADYDSDT